MYLSSVEITLPEWVKTSADWGKIYQTDEEKMSLAIDLSIENVRRETGGPFGAAIFDSEAGKLVSVGINQVVKSNNSALHAEVTAIMFAQEILQTYNLNFENKSRYELFTSCEPCCMCLGAILWSGAKRLICGAAKQDASQIGFDEGPVYESSYEYLAERGIKIKRNFMRDEAVEGFKIYKETGGVIYNS